MQQAISKHVVRVLAIELTDREKEQLDRPKTESAEAYQLYLKGRYLSNQKTPDGVQLGIDCLERAIKIDPRFALAYAEIASSQVLPVNPQPMIERMRQAKVTALKALELDETLAEAHTALGRAITFCDWDWAGAEKEFQRAIKLHPNYAEAHFWYAHNLSAHGRHEEAIAEMKIVQEGDPFSTRYSLRLAWTYYLSRHYDQAIAQLRQTPLELDSAYYQIYWRLGLVYAQQARYAEAIAMLQKAAGLSGERPLARASLGYVYAKSGRRAEAQQILAELSGVTERNSLPLITMAAIYACLGDNDRAFKCLNLATAQRENRMISLKVEPMLDVLRADPRFEALERSMGLRK
jgi:tetratricopeptide (TPR) repeat protein